MLTKVVFLMVVCGLLPLATPQTSDYCSISRKHTMCQYQSYGEACNGKPLRRGVSSQDIKEILDAHNRYRAKIAKGLEKRGKPGPQPPASNMREMIWDDELAAVAQRHADQCLFAHDCSTCRKVDRFGVGQNLYIYKQSQKLPQNNWFKGVTDWYNEVELFSRKEVEPFKFSAAIGHYSQLVWADTDKVGCGATSYKDGKWFATLYTCNYGPNGNYIRGQMYKQGEACSECPSGTTCSNTYPGLCSSLEEIKVPQFLPEGTTPKPIAPPVPASNQGGNRFVPPGRNITFLPIPQVSLVTTTSVPPTKTSTTTRPTTTTRRTTTSTTTRRSTTTTRTRPTEATTAKASKPQDLPALDVAEGVIFNCTFEEESKACKTRSTGVRWGIAENSFDGKPNTYYQVQLRRNDKTEMFFENLIAPPAGGNACLDFRYKKLSNSGRQTSMNVLAWPYRGKPGKISILRDSPDIHTWVRAQVTFRNINNYFLVMFKANGPDSVLDNLLLAVDDLTITAGSCEE